MKRLLLTLDRLLGSANDTEISNGNEPLIYEFKGYGERKWGFPRGNFQWRWKMQIDSTPKINLWKVEMNNSSTSIPWDDSNSVKTRINISYLSTIYKNELTDRSYYGLTKLQKMLKEHGIITPETKKQFETKIRQYPQEYHVLCGLLRTPELSEDSIKFQTMDSETSTRYVTRTDPHTGKVTDEKETVYIKPILFEVTITIEPPDEYKDTR
jgi:hypothetical protein